MRVVRSATDLRLEGSVGLVPTMGAFHEGHLSLFRAARAENDNLVHPDRAYFGQKDAQQAEVVKRMVGDLAVPVEIRVCPTQRDEDGLALSSRNAYLSAEERERALALPRALQAQDRSLLNGLKV